MYIGALIHTKAEKGKIALVFLDLMEWPHDSNLTTTILLHALKQVDRLPQVLYLQLDNCFRENKNRYVLSLCALLVEKKVFRKVKMEICKEKTMLVYVIYSSYHLS